MAALVKEATKWCEMLDKNPGEEWLKRVQALKGLKKMFEEQTDAANDPAVWTKELFQVMRLPIQRQIKDLRSGITKEVGEMMTALSIAAQDAAGPFFADQWVTIIDGFGGGNKVIFGHLDVCMKQVIPNTRIKKSMDRLCKEARQSKSNQLREFCAEYLYLILCCWGRDFLLKDVDTIEETIKKCLVDASPAVRSSARSAFFEFNNLFPDEGARLLGRLDSRAQKFLEQHVQAGGGGSPRAAASTPKGFGGGGSKSFSDKPKTLARSGSGSFSDKPKTLARSGSGSKSFSSTPSSASSPTSPSSGNLRKSPSSGGSSSSSSRMRAASPKAAPPPVPVEQEEEPEEEEEEEEEEEASEEALPSLNARVVAHVREGTYEGTVRFVGETAFAGGEWCGVELDVADGKNDGSVGGTRYFACGKNFGLFVRPAQLTIVVGEKINSGSNDALPPPPPRSRTGSAASDSGKKQAAGMFGGLGSMFGSGKAAASTVAAAAAAEPAGPEEWQAMGVDLLHEHKRHIDSVLSQLREEMELLADFERMQERLTRERVMTYNEAMRVCVEHRDELSSEFKTNVQACYDKYGVTHDNLSIEE